MDRFTVFGLFLLLLGACGQSNCSSEFVSDYNQVARAVRGMYTKDDLSRSLSLAQQFSQSMKA